MMDIDQDWLSCQYSRQFDTVELVVGGVNRTYRIREGHAVFYLRFYRPSGRTLPQIIAETSLLTQFPDSAHIGVSRPAPLANGTCIIEMLWNGEKRHACLFENAEGEQIALNPVNMERFGKSIAHLHLAMPAEVEGHVRKLDPFSIIENALQALRHIPQSGEVMAVIEKQYRPRLLQLDLSALPLGLCHGDPWTGNARFQEKRTVFFDFDDFGHGPLVLDLSIAAWHFTHGGNPDHQDMMDALIRGYQTVRPLTEPERNALPLFGQLSEIRSLLFLARHCTLSEDLWSITFEGALKALAPSSIS